MRIDRNAYAASDAYSTAIFLKKITRLCLYSLTAVFAITALSAGAPSGATEPPKVASKVLSIDQTDLQLAPYVWKRSGKSPGARARAAMPGAYLKVAFRGSTSLGLVVDGSINRGCPASSMPVIPKIWDHHDPATSRLSGGLLLPEPDFVFCSLGTNDYEKDITADYTAWLAEVRRACPHARVFCVVPPLGVHKQEIEASVKATSLAHDARVYLIDPARLAHGFRSGKGATHFAFDGVHPSGYGHAMLGAVIAVEAQKAFSREK